MVLSEMSKTFDGPELAHDARTLGEIDSESIQILAKDKSPTGKVAVLFSGAFSGATSLYEFTCDDETLDAKDSTSGGSLAGLFVSML